MMREIFADGTARVITDEKEMVALTASHAATRSVSTQEQDAGQFKWRVAEGMIQVWIEGWDLKEFAWLDCIEVIVKPGHAPLVHLHAGELLWEEDPREYDDAGRENFRSLLRCLGYRRMGHWRCDL